MVDEPERRGVAFKGQLAAIFLDKSNLALLVDVGDFRHARVDQPKAFIVAGKADQVALAYADGGGAQDVHGLRRALSARLVDHRFAVFAQHGDGVGIRIAGYDGQHFALAHAVSFAVEYDLIALEVVFGAAFFCRGVSS